MVRPKCKMCGRPASFKETMPSGVKRYKKLCGKCNQEKRETGYIYSQHKKEACEYCGFKPIHSCQLEVDHVDSNRKNNSPDNLLTLCANCHRLKTYLSRLHYGVPTYKQLMEV